MTITKKSQQTIKALKDKEVKKTLSEREQALLIEKEAEKRAIGQECLKRVNEVCEEMNCKLVAQPVINQNGTIGAQPAIFVN